MFSHLRKHITTNKGHQALKKSFLVIWISCMRGCWSRVAATYSELLEILFFIFFLNFHWPAGGAA